MHETRERGPLSSETPGESIVWGDDLRVRRQWRRVKFVHIHFKVMWIDCECVSLEPKPYPLCKESGCRTFLSLTSVHSVEQSFAV